MGGSPAHRRQLRALAHISVMNNSTSKWEYGLRAGLANEIILNFIAAVACIIYYSCASELTSAFPFPGGCFGFARCTVGFYPAYLIGCMEIFYYLFSLTISASSIALELDSAYSSMFIWRFLVVFAVYALQLGLCLNKKVFYQVATVLALYGIVISLIYIFGSFQHADFNKWAFRVDTSGKYWNDDGIATYPAVVDDDEFYKDATAVDVNRSDAMFNSQTSIVMQSIARCLSVFMQIEYANLAVDDAENPRRDIPFAMMVAAGIQVVFGTINPIVASMIPPGLEAVSKLPYPMIPGN
jgi:amino acid transporter